MSAVSESMNRRMTLGLLASRYGFDLDPTFATEVTITSIADDIDSVRPGSLFMPSAPVDEQQLRQAQALGAYGAVVPHALRGKNRRYTDSCDLCRADRTSSWVGLPAKWRVVRPIR